MRVMALISNFEEKKGTVTKILGFFWSYKNAKKK